MKKVILVSVLFALFLFACNPDETPTPTPAEPTAETQAVEPTDTPAPTATPQPISPLVVSAVPEQGQEQPLDAPVEISFDQPMDTGSVEKAFAIEPGASVDGTFEWSDDNRTVRFALNDGFERGQRYKVRVVESAASAAGLEMQRPF